MIDTMEIVNYYKKYHKISEWKKFNIHFHSRYRTIILTEYLSISTRRKIKPWIGKKINKKTGVTIIGFGILYFSCQIRF